ncbi:MAG: zinc ribbon domain-containing protein [Vicinamibacterales bacterium]
MSSETSTDTFQADSFQPWQFFTLVGLAAATALVFLAVFVWHTDRPAAILLSVTVGTAAFAGYAAWRTVAPLADDEAESTPTSVGGRTRAVLEREKLLTLRAIKDLEFDRAMKKVSEQDFMEMSGRLRVRAAGLIRQLDSTVSYRDEIDREMARRLSAGTGTTAAVATRACAGCGTANDTDAKFCKSCGAQLEAA